MSTTPALRSDEPAPAVPARPLGPLLAGHLAFTLLHTALFANVMWLIPMLVRLHFGAADPATRDWQTTLVTAAIPTFMVLSIFWHEVLERVRVRTYLLSFWLVAALPLGAIGIAQTYSQLVVCHVVAMIGLAGWTPIGGKLLKDFYADAIRGRVYAVLSAVALAGGVVAVYAVGRWTPTRRRFARTCRSRRWCSLSAWRCCGGWRSAAQMPAHRPRRGGRGRSSCGRSGRWARCCAAIRFFAATSRRS